MKEINGWTRGIYLCGYDMNIHKKMYITRMMPPLGTPDCTNIKVKYAWTYPRVKCIINLKNIKIQRFRVTPLNPRSLDPRRQLPQVLD